MISKKYYLEKTLTDVGYNIVVIPLVCKKPVELDKRSKLRLFVTHFPLVHNSIRFYLSYKGGFNYSVGHLRYGGKFHFLSLPRNLHNGLKNFMSNNGDALIDWYVPMKQNTGFIFLSIFEILKKCVKYAEILE